MRIYIAAPIFNDHQLWVVRGIDARAKLCRHETFSPYENSQEIWAGRKPAECEPWERAQVITDNIAGLKWCDCLLAWVGGTDDGKPDTGAVWEMGYASALSGAPMATQRLADRPITLAFIHDDDTRQDLNLMLSATVDAVVKGFKELQEALHVLSEEPKRLQIIFHPNRLIKQEREPLV